MLLVVISGLKLFFKTLFQMSNMQDKIKSQVFLHFFLLNINNKAQVFFRNPNRKHFEK